MRKMKLLIGFLVAIMMTAGWMPSVSMAKAKITIKPLLTVGWRSDSNFFKKDENERTVYTYEVSPGIELGMDSGKSKVLFKYVLKSESYSEQDDVPAGVRSAEEDDFVAHTGSLTAETTIKDKLKLGLEERLQETRDGADADALSNSIERELYTLNTFRPYATYAITPQFKATVAYRNKDKNYDRDTEVDATENRGSLNLTYDLTKTLTAGLDFDYWNQDYDRQATDYDAAQVMLKLDRTFKYFKLGGGLGYQNRTFDDGGPDDIDTAVFSLTLSGQNPAFGEGPARSRIKLTSDVSLNDLDTADSYYKTYKTSLSLGRTFYEKLDIDLTGTYSLSDYEYTDREDDTYTLEGKGEYRPKEWVALILKAGVENRDSNTAGNDYDNTYVLAQVRIMYDMGSR